MTIGKPLHTSMSIMIFDDFRKPMLEYMLNKTTHSVLKFIRSQRNGIAHSLSTIIYGDR